MAWSNSLLASYTFFDIAQHAAVVRGDVVTIVPSNVPAKPEELTATLNEVVLITMIFCVPFKAAQSPVAPLILTWLSEDNPCAALVRTTAAAAVLTDVTPKVNEFWVERAYPV